MLAEIWHLLPEESEAQFFIRRFSPGWFSEESHPYPIWLSVSRVSFPKDNPPFGFNRLVGASLQKPESFFSSTFYHAF